MTRCVRQPLALPLLVTVRAAGATLGAVNFPSTWASTDPAKVVFKGRR